MYKILAINLGSTSTKLAYYQDEYCAVKENIPHPVEEIKRFPDIFAQYDYRLDSVMNFIKKNNIIIEQLDAIVSRGGHTRPIEGGTYRINQVMLNEIKSGKFGRHPCDLGSFIAVKLCELAKNAVPLVVDPPVTDEFEPLARLSGLKQIPRVSKFQALNQRAVAKKLSKDLGRKYEDLTLIVVHMGGGVSVCAHKHGKMIDANNALDGDGPYAPERSGGLPSCGLIDMCFSGDYTKEDMYRQVNGMGGLMSYLGTSDIKEIEALIDKGDEDAAYYLEGMCYQIAKEIGAMATVLKGKIDAICLTGGAANSKRVVELIKSRVSFLSHVYVYPGEDEMEALALGALNALRKEEKIKEIQ